MARVHNLRYSRSTRGLWLPEASGQPCGHKRAIGKGGPVLLPLCGG